MKRLALLLAAMGIVTVGAAAAELKVTNIGQELEIENTSGAENIGEATYLTTSVGLSYGDWTFGVAGTKFWHADTDSIKSYDGRLQLDAWKKVTDDLKLGLRYRGYDSEDRYYVRWDYSQDWFWSAGDIWYQANNAEGGARDAWRGEVYPLGFKYGAFKAGWFVDWTQNLGGLEAGDQDYNFEHQIRAYFDFYKTEKLTLSLEGRFTLTVDDDYKDGEEYSKASRYEDFGRNRLYLGAKYAVNEKLDVYAKYGYEVRDKEYVNNGKEDKNGNYFGDFIVGWNYKF